MLPYLVAVPLEPLGIYAFRSRFGWAIGAIPSITNYQTNIANHLVSELVGDGCGLGSLKFILKMFEMFEHYKSFGLHNLKTEA